jgi:DNA polymerase-3 subunit epsilon
MLDEHAVFVDLETTGATASRDRITEIGIVEVNRGRLIGEWSTLVNPEMGIPPAIQVLTGITDKMVATAPTFSEIRRDLLQRLEGKLFIAHNARFDYGFIQNAFARCGISFNARVLCTVKLSRRLYPQHPRHNLDILLERHDLSCEARHRALGDARVLWLLGQKWTAERGTTTVQAAVDLLLNKPSLPAGLPDFDFDAIPQAPGIYFFYGDQNAPLYIGRSVNMRARAMAHFSGDHRVSKDMRIAQQVRRIDWKQTAGELGALLLEARLVKQFAPVHNRKMRRDSQWCAWHWQDSDGDSAPQLVDAGAVDPCDPAQFGELYGRFRSRATAMAALRDIATAHGLCGLLLGLEKRPVPRAGACYGHMINRCRGACVGLESTEQHALRLKTALTSLQMQPWPFAGRIAIREEAGDGEVTEMHVVDHWCHLGTARSEAELHELAENRAAPVFDVDIYKILKRFLAKPPRGASILRLAV